MKNNKYIVLGLAATVAVLIIAAVALPLWEERNNSIDRAIESDFLQISQLVDEYYSDSQRLPDSLSELELSETISDRAHRYDYALDKETSTRYELCAQFKTDTTNPVPDEFTSFDIGYYNDRSHTSGYDCIQYEAFGYYFDEPTAEPAFDDFFEFDGSEDSVEPFPDIETLELQEL